MNICLDYNFPMDPHVHLLDDLLVGSGRWVSPSVKVCREISCQKIQLEHVFNKKKLSPRASFF